jgi:hypothetical protein
VLTELDPVVNVKTKHFLVVEEVQQVKHALGSAVGKPSGCDKKTKSINQLCAVEVQKEKKSSGKKDKKFSSKKRQKK